MITILIGSDQAVFCYSSQFSLSEQDSGVPLQSEKPCPSDLWKSNHVHRSSCWLHDRYSELIRLLDAELMRVTMRSRHDDQRIETVQALLLCAHWMPFDLVDHREKFRSRFSEGGAWQCLGLAIRWASYISLDRTCHVNFHNPETVTRHDARRFRTMIYLVESDH
jgi:hypothetical protein